MGGTNVLQSGVTFPQNASPHALLNDGNSFDVVTLSGNSTAINGWNLVTSSGAVISIPSGLSSQTHLLKIVDWNGSAALTVSGTPAGSVTINGASTYAINSAYGHVTLFCSGDSNYRSV